MEVIFTCFYLTLVLLRTLNDLKVNYSSFGYNCTYQVCSGLDMDLLLTFLGGQWASIRSIRNSTLRSLTSEPVGVCRIHTSLLISIFLLYYVDTKKNCFVNLKIFTSRVLNKKLMILLIIFQL